MTQICKMPRTQWCSKGQILEHKLYIRVTETISPLTEVKTEFTCCSIHFKGYSQNSNPLEPGVNVAFKNLFCFQCSYIIKMEESNKHLQFLEKNWKSIRTL